MATPPDLARDLRAAGLPISDLWELVNAKAQYKPAIPVLIDWLRNVDRRVPGPDQSGVREGLVRALSVPAARPSHRRRRHRAPRRTGCSARAQRPYQRPDLPMSGRPFLRTRQKAGRLPGWRICSGSTRLTDAHPILNGSLKDIEVYDCEVSELDAIARNTGLADRAAVGARQVGLVVEAKHIDRDASRGGAQANAIKLSRRPVGVGDGVGTVANVRVGHNLTVRVRAIGEPKPASGKFSEDMCMQPSEVGLLGLGLTGEVRLDLLGYIHLAPHASSELSHAGSDGRRPSIAGGRMDGRQPRTERPSARSAALAKG